MGGSTGWPPIPAWKSSDAALTASRWNRENTCCVSTFFPRAPTLFFLPNREKCPALFTKVPPVGRDSGFTNPAGCCWTKWAHKPDSNSSQRKKTLNKRKNRRLKAEVNKEVISARLEIVLRNFLFIWGKFVLWDKFTDKIKNNLYLLYPVSAWFIRSVDDNFFNKLIYNRRC